MELELNITYIKILETVYLLNKDNAFPMMEGVRKILKGELDKETIIYQDLKTFSTLISIGNRRLASDIKMLIRYQYLKYIYDEESDSYYLKITIKGETALDKYQKTHKTNYKKTNKKFKKTILQK